MMHTPKERDFDKTPAAIAIAMGTWANWPGYSGESCGHCRRTANVYAGGPGWFCICGHYNCQSWNNHMMPHTVPDLGPAAETIRKGSDLFMTYGRGERADFFRRTFDHPAPPPMSDRRAAVQWTHAKLRESYA